MTLSGLVNRKNLHVLGINSGTSADGVDLAVMRVSKSGRKISTRFLAGTTRKYPKSLRALIVDVSTSQSIAPKSIIYLDNLLGQFYGRAAKRYIASLVRQGIKLDLVASHGQTVRHLPRKVAYGGKRVNGTLQLGSLELIAAETGQVVTGDFRQADIALGNEGAPITVAAMALVFGHPKESRLIVNIGGIANYFYLPAGGRMADVRAADCGPGNSLLDILTQALFSKPFDRGGRYAVRGNVSQRLMSILLAHPFFKTRTVSTGREMFGVEMAREMIAFGKKFSLSGEDLLATAAEFTVYAIADSVVEFVAGNARLRKIYLTGGGSRNRFIAGRLRDHLDNIAVRSIDELGVKANLVEASAYAVMGAMTLWSHPLQTKFTGGRPQAVWPVLGKIVQPPVRVK